MVQRASPSLKRRRSWLEIGIAGCSLLASPAEAAWPSFGSIWSSFSHAPAHDHHLRAEVPRARQHGDHHGTHLAASVPSHRSLGPPPASQTSHRRRTNRGDQQQHHPADHVGPARPALQASVEGTLPLPSPPSSTRARALEVEIAVHGRHGDWQACSPDTCTQTRLVFCETLDSRIIVADDLCGEELPDAEQPCSDEAAAAVCRDDAAAAPSGAGRDGKQGASATSTAGKGVDTRGVGGKGVETGGSRNRAPSSSPSTAAGNTPQKSPSAAAGSRGVGGPQGAQEVASPGAPSRGVGHEPPSKTPGTTVPVEDGGAARAGEPSEEGDARGGDETDEAAGAKKTGSAATDNGSREEEQERRGAAQNRNKSSEASSPKQDEAGKKSSSGGPHDEEPSPPVLARIGGTASKSSREEYRFWVVLAIGAGAVGSFMAVVVFAVGQYRKEQHRLRGIMALNEFPQDNYINPFARQLSSELQLSADDRSAFKL